MATVSKSDNSTEPHDASILVSDGDYELENAQLIIRSSNPLLSFYVEPSWEGEHPKPYVYKVDFWINEALAVGKYSIILTADDGVGSDWTVLSLTVEA